MPRKFAMTDPNSWIAGQIRHHRERRGWSQSVLADHLGRTQTAVSYWESGRRTPGLDDLFDLADAFDLGVDSFIPPERSQQPVTALLRATAERLASDELTQAIEDVLTQAESAAMPPVELAVGSQQPAYAANDLLEKARVEAPPVNVRDLATRCGVLVVERPFPDDLSGLVFPYEEAAVVGINSSHHPRRQRFSLAHELGHFLLDHHQSSAGNDARLHIDVDEGNSAGFDWRAERAANDFAADLLMPRRMVTELFESTPEPAGLAKTFDVSELAMGYRLVNLGLR